MNSLFYVSLLQVNHADLKSGQTYNCSLSDMPEVMKQMPPLPVTINEELANSILPRTTMPMLF